MIPCRLFGHDDVHDVMIELPAVPHAGDRLFVPHCSSYTYRITEVRFHANDPIVTLILEWGI